MPDDDPTDFFSRPVPAHFTDEQRAKILVENERYIRADLKRWPGPQLLYKFRPCEERDLSTFEADQIWIPSFSDLHLGDPFDGRLPVSVGGAVRRHGKQIFTAQDENGRLIELSFAFGNREAMEEDPDVVRTRYERALESIRSRSEKLGCYCMSANCTNPRLWDEHGRGFTGFCVAYDFTFDPDQVDVLDPITMANQVNYAEPLPPLDLFELFHLSLGQANNRLFSFKRKIFKWEDEYRILGREGRQLYPRLAPVASLLVGYCAPPEACERLKRYASRAGIPFRVAIFKDMDKVEIVDYADWSP